MLAQAALEDFQSFLKKNFHFGLTQSEGATRLVLARMEEGDPEAYRIEVSEQEICISSAGEAGLFYALQTLKQILLTNSCKIPSLSINDAPLYHYRGFMLDVGRYFYPVEEVKHFLDLMAVHKLNIFHWHLTEDQGWRVEIKKTSAPDGVWLQTLPHEFWLSPHSGFYTQEDIREVVAYAHSKYIKVIPEIDMPATCSPPSPVIRS